jgi:hypothetical protein
MDKTRIQTKTKKRRLKKKSKRRVVEARDNANTTSADLRHNVFVITRRQPSLEVVVELLEQ